VTLSQSVDVLIWLKSCWHSSWNKFSS